jgi:hypothetical protein
VKTKTNEKCFFFQASAARAADAAIARTRPTSSSSTLSRAASELEAHEPPPRVVATRQSLPAAVAALSASVGPSCCPPAAKKSPRVAREGAGAGGDPPQDKEEGESERQGRAGEADREGEERLLAPSSLQPSRAKSDDVTDAEREAARDASSGTDVLAASGLERSTLPMLDRPTSTLEKASPRLSAAAISLRMCGTT